MQLSDVGRAQQRQAVVTSSAAEGAGGELIRLRAELEARGSALERAEVELAAQQGAAAARLAEMQAGAVGRGWGWGWEWGKDWEWEWGWGKG